MTKSELEVIYKRPIDPNVMRLINELCAAIKSTVTVSVQWWKIYDHLDERMWVLLDEQDDESYEVLFGRRTCGARDRYNASIGYDPKTAA
jgi:hypothetical protein